jgi:ribosomal protein S3AE
MAEKSGARRRTVDKWKKKKWFFIKASKIFDGKVLAETPAEKPINLVGRTLKVTLDKLTGQRMKRDVTVNFKTFDVQGQNINTKISQFSLSKSSLGRIVRRGNSKVMVAEKVSVVGGNARITLILITVRKATSAQKTGLRKVLKNNLDSFKEKDFEDVVKELMLGKLTSSIQKEAESICMVKKVIASKAVFSEAK